MPSDITTRLLNNEGDPLCFPDGTKYANAPVSFELVDAVKKKPVSLFDLISGEFIIGEVVTVQTNSEGVLSTPMWPNGRGEFTTLYRVTLDNATDVFKPFYIMIADGTASITLLQARIAYSSVGGGVDTSELDALINTLNEKADSIGEVATESTDGMMSAADKTKLDGVAAGANNYSHPANHPASMITQDTTMRFVSDAEKAGWSSKEPAIVGSTSNKFYAGDKTFKDIVASMVAEEVDKLFMTSAERAKLATAKTADQTITLTGNVTGSGTGTFAATISNGAVTFAKLANLQALSLIGNPAGSSYTPQAVTMSMLKTMLALTESDIISLTTDLNAINSSLSSLSANKAESTALNTKADIASPTFTGIPAVPTAAADTNTTQAASTAYVLGQASTSNPVAAGAPVPGTSKKFSREDHVHPQSGTFSAGVSPGNSNQSGTTVLDWYEENTFNPTLVGTTAAGVGTYTKQLGHFTRIGNRVFFTIILGWSAHTGTGNMRVDGLPYTSDGTTNLLSAVTAYYDGIAVGSGKQFVGYVGSNSTSVILGAADPAGAVGTAAIAMDTSVAYLALSGHYKVA